MRRLHRKLGASVPGVLLSFAAAALLAQAPTPTPRAKPRLSGGFGRPRVVTPTPSADAPRPSGELAPAAEKKGKPGEKSGISITNETLVTDPSKGKLTTTTRSPAPTPRPGSAGAPSRTVEAEVPFDGSAPGTAPSEEEAKWRAAARSARERVETLKLRITQLEGEEAKLQSDFYAWDDGQYRDGVIKPAWDRKREELEQARRELAEADKELADLPEKARKAGALPGWLRE